MKFVSQENRSVSQEIDFDGQEMNLVVKQSLFLLRNDICQSGNEISQLRNQFS